MHFVAGTRQVGTRAPRSGLRCLGTICYAAADDFADDFADYFADDFADDFFEGADDFADDFFEGADDFANDFADDFLCLVFVTFNKKNHAAKNS